MTRRSALIWFFGSLTAAAVLSLAVRTSFLAGREFSKSASRVGFVEAELSLGVHEWGTKAVAELYFENRTQSAVTLAGVSSSCGCAVVADAGAFEKRVIQSGEVISIPFELAVGTTSPARSAQIVAILEDGRRFSATVKAQVRFGWFVSTQHLDIGDVKLGTTKPVSREFSFSSSADRITDLSSAARWLTSEAMDSREKQQVVTVRVDPTKLPPGVNRATLQFSTTSKTVPKGAIQVSARGVTDLSPVPAKVFLRPGSSVTVRFVGSDGVAVELQSVETLSSAIQTELQKGGHVLISAAANAYSPNGTAVRVRDRLGRAGEVQVTTVHLKGESP